MTDLYNKSLSFLFFQLIYVLFFFIIEQSEVSYFYLLGLLD